MFFFRKTTPTTAPEKQAIEPPRFVARLKKDVGEEIWAVSQEDHFIRVYGDKGEDRILYRFSDAVHDLRGHNGTCVHLAHWVLKDAIKRIDHVDDTYEIVLKNDKRFPVCESYRRVLQESEWDMTS
ncbi:hypothetical protein GCM10011332_21790 [Terasakiella brassicae]|uniref:HTH LytTR-type domain-containing protein n=1 Tax=Terasakiella brassicae TaxID=1634917 RepID=A0A917C2V0_9PROT|nr:LytTR family transcriptional regulator DNA-binding domain-containing protein [Terasakiella brassicae]GGF67333.1 hypothetical protein GCM10011332_21790 [Terasakiella brassicae]